MSNVAMSLGVLLFRNKLLLGPNGSKLLAFTAEACRLHDDKTEFFESITERNLNSAKNKLGHNKDLVNRKFFSGTTQGSGENTYQKIERVGFKILAKGEFIFNTIRNSNEVSVVMAAGRKTCRTVSNAFRKKVWENDRVAAARKGFKEKYEQAREKENRK